MKLFSSLLLLQSVFADEEDVVVLTDANFDEFVASNSLSLIGKIWF
jgi:hypothetical protein